MVRDLRQMLTDTHWSVSITTRRRRVNVPGQRDEVNGEDYIFVDDITFDALVQAGWLVESARFGGARYGTPHPRGDMNVLIECDTQGAATIKRKYPWAKLIWIAPPGATIELQIDCLAARHRRRGTPPDVAASRLGIARRELELAPELYECTVVNFDGHLASAVAETYFHITGVAA
jgi:guanylate kinase